MQKPIQLMNDAKQAVFAEIAESGVTPSPTVNQALHNFSLFLDSAYLWLTQLQFHIQQGGTDEVPADAEEKIVNFPGSDAATEG